MNEEMIRADVQTAVMVAFSLAAYPKLDGDEHVQKSYMEVAASRPVELPPL